MADLPVSWVLTVLEGLATKYLKRWSGLAHSADIARLYLPKQDGGLGLPSVSLLHKKMKLTEAATLLASRDSLSRQVATRRVLKEDKSVRSKLHPLNICQDIMRSDPGISHTNLSSRAKNQVTNDDAAKRREHTVSLPSQGELMRAATFAPDIWANSCV